MHDVVIVQVFDTFEDLANDLGGVSLGELAATRDLFKQFSARRELEDEVELFARLKMIVQLDFFRGTEKSRQSAPSRSASERFDMPPRLTDVGMIEPGEDVNLVDNCLEVALERLFADHLDRDFDLPADLFRVCIVRVVWQRCPSCLFDPASEHGIWSGGAHKRVAETKSGYALAESAGALRGAACTSQRLGSVQQSATHRLWLLIAERPDDEKMELD